MPEVDVYHQRVHKYDRSLLVLLGVQVLVMVATGLGLIWVSDSVIETQLALLGGLMVDRFVVSARPARLQGLLARSLR